MSIGRDLPSTRRRKRQVHIFLSDREYDWLRNQALMRDDTISNTVRELCFDKSVTNSLVQNQTGFLQSSSSYEPTPSHKKRISQKSG